MFVVKTFPMFFKERGVWKVFVLRELPHSYRERGLVGVVIKELLFSYKARRMEGLIDSQSTPLISRHHEHQAKHTNIHMHICSLEY